MLFDQLIVHSAINQWRCV